MDLKRFIRARKGFRALSVAVAAVLFLSPCSFGYEEIAVTRGATLSGKVTLHGPVPSSAVFRLIHAPFSEFCQKIADENGNIVLDEYHVGPDGGMQDTLVAVQQVPKGKRFAPIQAKFFATDCMFHPAEVSHHAMYQTDPSGRIHHVHPLVTVFQENQPVSVINNDPVVHNGQVFQQETGHILLNFPIAVSSQPQGGLLKFEKGRKLSQMICGMHEYMQAYGLAVDNPYYAKTNGAGEFTISQLPQGRYQVLAWHPHFKPMIKEVIVSAGESISLNFTFESKGVGPRIFELAAGLRPIESQQ
jgi:hypothetical protein